MRFLFVCFVLLFTAPSYAAESKAEQCQVDDRGCVINELIVEAGKIENSSWRDQTYREIAKTLAFENRINDAIDVLDKVENPDTYAMTIRGIGMAAADNNLSAEEYTGVFKALRIKADTIEHPPSFAIALTYIAMAQAFAGDDEGAWTTATEMDNDALRHKAYGETAEIQAEQGKVDAALKSITFIESESYRDKAYSIVSKILADSKEFSGALKAAQAVTNSYKKAAALQYVLDKQKPRELVR